MAVALVRALAPGDDVGDSVQRRAIDEAFASEKASLASMVVVFFQSVEKQSSHSGAGSTQGYIGKCGRATIARSEEALRRCGDQRE